MVDLPPVVTESMNTLPLSLDRGKGKWGQGHMTLSW